MIRGLVLKTIIVTIVLATVLVPACNKEVPTPRSLTASEIIGNAIESMKAVNSFHFDLVHEGGGTPIAMGLELSEAKGAIAKPDKLKTTIMATMSGMLVEVEVITIGTTTYMTNPLTKQWELPPSQFSTISIFDPNIGITAILEDLVNPTKLGEERIDTIDYYHIKGEIPVESLRPITLTSVEGVNVAVEVWIDKEYFLINWIRLEGQITETEAPGIVRTIELSNYNQAVEIEAPM